MLDVEKKIEIQKALAVIKFQYIRLVLADLHIVFLYIMQVYVCTERRYNSNNNVNFIH
jgi:hypothetical protein